MTDEDAFMDDEQAGDAVARYFEDNPELLQGIVPAHDFWPSIESRISARVIPISAIPTSLAGSRASRATRAGRSLGWIPMLAAASALIAASAGITYVLTSRAATQGAAPSMVASAPAQSETQTDTQSETHTATKSATQPDTQGAALAHNDVTGSGRTNVASTDRNAGAKTQLASHGAAGASDGMRQTYDAEIATLHSALEARRGQLNPATVSTIEQNLRVIDEAIRQSKEALEKDPNSRLLNDQLDHSLATKTSLLRAAALLPAA